ncbi:MAG: hypothetical protein KUG65_13255 [Sphingomonadaceae bacterium]|nr:hypothetical protein [Sphingomonadaceae bacterium]
MLQMIEANWIAFALVLLIGLLVARWIFAHGSKVAPPGDRKPDAMDEDAPPAQRNQAFLDAPSAAALADSGPDIMGGIGGIVAAAAHEEVEEAQGHAPVEEAQRAPLAEPAAPPAASASPAQDDLRKIKGVGPKLVTLLNSLGVTTFAQIAAWDEAEIDRIDAQLGAFAGRIRRDSWIEQAELLSSGDSNAYEARFGKL